MRTIQVSEKQTASLIPERATIHLRLKQENHLNKKAVLNQASLLKTLVDGLVNSGIEKESISVESIEAEVEKGLLSRSSRAAYLVAIQSLEIEDIPRILDVIPQIDNSRLDKVFWEHDICQEFVNQLFRQATERALSRAQVIATMTQAKVIGLSSCESLFYRKSAKDERLYVPAGMYCEEAVDSQAQTRGLPAAIHSLKDIQLRPSHDFTAKIDATFEVSESAQLSNKD